MHGRVKVKTSEQQLKEKRKQRQKKLNAFQGAVKLAFKKIYAEEYDTEGMEVTKGILSSNCDYTTMWNYRKKAFTYFKGYKSLDDLETSLKAELHFVEACLRNNPKSYGSWEQRCFVMVMMAEPNWVRELHLCDLFLQLDDRNFHCWDYRRFVTDKSKVPAEKEIAFTNTLIENNFSNYSSWHYRSKLLPTTYPDNNDGSRIAETQLLEELNLVQNAFFTDPNDQSAWFYHRWLLGRGETKQYIISIRALKDPLTVICTLRKPVKLSDIKSAVVVVDDEEQEGNWESMSYDKYSNSWVFKPVIQRCPGYTSPRVVCSFGGAAVSCRVGPMDYDEAYVSDIGWHSFGEYASDAKRALLEDELKSCEELNELEPGNKWVVLTLALLMRALNPSQYLSTITNHLTSLCSIDNKRSYYYNDLMSRYQTEHLLSCANLSSEKIDFSGKGLTRLCHGELLAHVTQLDVSGNQLTSLGQPFSLLVSLKILIANNNKIKRIEGMRHLQNLRELELRSNDISTVEALHCLSECSSLQGLYLLDNPLTTLPMDEVTKRFTYDVDIGFDE